ncbi:DUF2922 domain-containing protein [Metabacillus fastidiosus]|uniref:DUF2922 domain-containing protein n=1 Tax=Metabacillus fastidiosus TaxID=1458 RepID=UPI002DB7B83D|nr:DUF2922 domain-containing protein [Metabacillus fastidiosus]MEC2075853.1 DUF2922 domain-containing protein [Metabacillus fastidiosus]MED4533405.1 DUF2922 domain-containing protein [Metabacillus fastidiosus]
MAKVLELVFDAEHGTAKLTVRNPKDSLTPLEVKTAMDQMVQGNVFTTTNGFLVSPKSARIIDRTTQDIVLP